MTYKRETCEEHDKVLYLNRHDAVSALMGGLKSKRVRTYPCTAHKGKVHMTKESIKYR